MDKWKVIFVLCSFVYGLQQKLLLVTGFMGSFSGEAVNNPRTHPLNLSAELGHMKAAVFLSELIHWGRSSGDPKLWRPTEVPRCFHLSAPEGAGAFVQGDFAGWVNVSHMFCTAPATALTLLVGPAGSDGTCRWRFWLVVPSVSSK